MSTGRAEAPGAASAAAASAMVAVRAQMLLTVMVGLPGVVGGAGESAIATIAPRGCRTPAVRQQPGARGCCRRVSGWQAVSTTVAVVAPSKASALLDLVAPVRCSGSNVARQ